MTNTILWEKWRDPLSTAIRKHRRLLDKDDDYERHRAKFLGEPDEGDDDELDDEFDDDDDDDDFDRPFAMRKHTAIGPAIVGPIGIIPLYEDTSASKLFNFWMGHTTFRIKERHVGDILEVNGVESLDVYTRHRFRVSVGKAFDDEQVREQISNLFVERQPVAARPLDLMQRGLTNRYPFWAIHRTNGRTNVYGADTQAAVIDKTNHLEGELITSWGQHEGL